MLRTIHVYMHSIPMYNVSEKITVGPENTVARVTPNVQLIVYGVTMVLLSVDTPSQATCLEQVENCPGCTSNATCYNVYGKTYCQCNAGFMSNDGTNGQDVLHAIRTNPSSLNSCK